MSSTCRRKSEFESRSSASVFPFSRSRPQPSCIHPSEIALPLCGSLFGRYLKCLRCARLGQTGVGCILLSPILVTSAAAIAVVPTPASSLVVLARRKTEGFIA